MAGLSGSVLRLGAAEGSSAAFFGPMLAADADLRGLLDLLKLLRRALRSAVDGRALRGLRKAQEQRLRKVCATPVPTRGSYKLGNFAQLILSSLGSSAVLYCTSMYRVTRSTFQTLGFGLGLGHGDGMDTCPGSRRKIKTSIHTCFVYAKKVKQTPTNAFVAFKLLRHRRHLAALPVVLSMITKLGLWKASRCVTMASSIVTLSGATSVP